MERLAFRDAFPSGDPDKIILEIRSNTSENTFSGRWLGGSRSKNNFASKKAGRDPRGPRPAVEGEDHALNDAFQRS
jgi:hypothetical protein